MAQLSYNYRMKTVEPIEPGGTVVMHYPLADADSGNVDQGAAQLVVGNKEFTADESDIEFDQATTTITVTNNTDEAWPPQTDIVVVVPRDPELIDDLRETLIDHEDRITALEGGGVSAAATARKKAREAKAKREAEAKAMALKAKAKPKADHHSKKDD